MSVHRICAEPRCTTVLSVRNPGLLCWEHTPDLADAPWLRHGEYADEGFIAGIAGTDEPPTGDLTPACPMCGSKTWREQRPGPIGEVFHCVECGAGFRGQVAQALPDWGAPPVGAVEPREGW